MSFIRRTNFYPDNQVTSATEVNANNNAINGSTGRLDAFNVRIEGIDMVNLSGNPHIKWLGRVDNGAYASLGTAPSTYNGWIYNAFTIPGTPAGQHYSQTGSINATFDYPINHDNTFTINNAANVGTKLQVNSTTGIALEHHMKIQVDWNVNVWDIYHNGLVNRVSPASYMSELVDTALSGIGVGEYYYLIYPKFNTIGSSLTNSDFQAPQDAGFYQDLGDDDYFTPDDLTNGNSDVLYAFQSRRFDHCSIVPMHIVTATETASGGGRFATYAGYDIQSQEYQLAGGPMQICGQHTFEVNVAAGGGKTLYGVQMFISGPYRLNSQGQFLESERTDPGGSPAQYGVDVSVALERAAMNVTILTPQTGRQ